MNTAYIWHCYYGEELSRLGEEEKAEEHLRRSLELEFNKGAALHLSRLLHRTGQVEERERLREQTEAELGDASFMDRRSVAD